jgi:hypothetical protein
VAVFLVDLTRDCAGLRAFLWIRRSSRETVTALRHGSHVTDLFN